jgi:hypothetical protein
MTTASQLRCARCGNAIGFTTNLICTACHPELAERFKLTDEAAADLLLRVLHNARPSLANNPGETP